MKIRATVAAMSASVLLLVGCGSQQAAAPATVTVPTTTVKTSLVQVTRTTSSTVATTLTMPTTVTVTVTAAGAEAGGAPTGNGPTGPFSDGTYLVGSEVGAGNYKCNAADSSTRWIIEDSAGETVDIDFSSVARVPANGYTVQFKACSGQWEKVG